MSEQERTATAIGWLAAWFVFAAILRFFGLI